VKNKPSYDSLKNILKIKLNGLNMKKYFLAIFTVALLVGCSEPDNLPTLPTEKSFFSFCEKLQGYGKNYRKDMSPKIARMILKEKDGIEDSSEFIQQFNVAVAMGNVREAFGAAENAAGSYLSSSYQEESTSGAFETGCVDYLLDASFEKKIDDKN